MVMNWQWQEVPVSAGIDEQKMADRIQEKNGVTDGFGALYNSICITADGDNADCILISDYTEDNQTNDGNIADFIAMKPEGRINLPWNNKVSALNRPLVKWQAGDVITVVTR